MAGPSEITISSIFKSVFQHKFLFSAITALGMLVVVGVFMMLEKKYASEGQLFVQLGRASVGLDPTVTASSTISVMDSRETEIRSIVDLIVSRGVAEEVVRRIGPDRILATKFNFIQIPSLSALLDSDAEGFDEKRNRYAEGRSGDEQKDFEEAVKKFSDDLLEVSAERKTSILTVYCKASSPILAKDLTDTVLEITRSLHLKVSYVNESQDFFESEFSHQNDKLTVLEQELEEFRNERGVLTIDAERSLTQSIIDRLTNRILDAQADVIELNTELQAMSVKLEKTDEFVELESRGMESSSRSGADQKLIELKGQLANLLQRYSNNHYSVVQLKTEIGEIASEIGSRQEKRTESSKSRNSVYESLELSYAQKSASQTAKEELLEHLRGQLAKQNPRMTQLNQDLRHSESLKQSIAIARSGVIDFAEKKRQSSVLAELNKQQISNLEVASSGSFVTKHIFPKASLVLPLGLVASVALATLLCFRRSQKPETRIAIPEVERGLGVPVLVTLPRVPAVVRS